MRIRRYIHEDRFKVLELIRAVYDEAAYKIAAQRFQWQFEDNPNNRPQDPLIYVTEHDHNIIGMFCAFAQKVKMGNSVYPAYWLGDFMVHPDHRSGLNGLKLVRTMVSNPHLVMGFPVEYLIKIYFRIGAIQSSQLLRYSRTFQTSSQKGPKIADRLRSFLNGRDLQGIRIVEVNYFDERFDRLWERASKDYQALQVRDSLYLNWRFFKCPYISYRVLTAVKKNEVLGYVVLRIKGHEGISEGSIVDLFTDRSESAVTAILMEEGVNFFKNNGCAVIRMTISSTDDLLIKTMQQFSFMDCEKIDRGLIYNNMSDDLNSVIKESSNWFLTRADSDMDFTD